MDSIDPRRHHSLTVTNRQPVTPPGVAGLPASGRGAWRLAAATLCVVACLTSRARAQAAEGGPPVQLSDQMDDRPLTVFKSEADSLAWERSRAAAFRGTGLRVLVSLRERQVLVMRDADTLRAATAAVASGMTIEYGGRSWTFRTPRGRHTVLRKVEDPVWRPPDWMYAEAAIAHDLELAPLRPDRPVRVNADQLLVVRNGAAGLLDRATREFAPLPTDEHIVFNDTLYIPPIVTRNRRVEGELGRFALDLGDGYLIHGTADPKSIGRAVTHGCIRLGDDDIDWLYRHVPVGTVVHIY